MSDKASQLRAAISNQETKASMIRSAVQGGSRFGQGFLGGVESRAQSLASMISGDPEMRGLPPVRDVPESLSGRMGAASFDAAVMAAPIGRVFSAVKPAQQGATGIQATLRNVVSDIGQTYQRAPARFIAVESGLGASSGAGGFYAEQAFPESDAARFIGEIGGGMAPSAVAATGRQAVRALDAASNISPTIAAGKRFAVNTWDEVARSIDARTAGSRATQRFQRAIGELAPSRVIQSMDEPLLDEARAIMTPAQISGNRGLLSLERSLADSIDSLRNKREEDLIRLNSVIKSSFSSPQTSETARTAVERTRQEYFNLLNERVRVAALKADEDLQRMIPGLGEEEANRIARRELEKAFSDSMRQEREFFNKIDFSAIAPTRNVRNTLDQVLSEAGVAGRKSVPGYAIDLFSSSSPNFLGVTNSVKELREAQSQLRTIARNARVGTQPDMRLAAFADRIASAITDDLELTQGANPELIRQAVDFSRARHEVFSQGSVGRILRTSSDSGDFIPEMLTLDKTLGASGIAGAQAFDDIVNAAAFSRDRAGYEGSDSISGAMARFIQNEFVKSSVRGGRVDRNLAEAFVRNNEVTLNRFPEIKNGIIQSVESGSALDSQEALRKLGIQTFDDPSVSKATLLLQKGPVRAFEDIFSSRNPILEARNVVSLMGSDPTGEAISGLKQGFMDYLVSKSDSGGFISGERLSELISNQNARGVISSLFNEEEKRRLLTIVRTAQRADAARAAIPSTEGVTGDRISKSSDMLLGILGAAYGRQVSTNLGGGTVQIPGIFANRFRELGAAGLANPAKRLIIDALGDERLFRQVLMATPVNGALNQQANRRLNAWAAATLAREGLSPSGQDQANTTEE